MESIEERKRPPSLDLAGRRRADDLIVARPVLSLERPGLPTRLAREHLNVDLLNLCVRRVLGRGSGEERLAANFGQEPVAGGKDPHGLQDAKVIRVSADKE